MCGFIIGLILGAIKVFVG
ncbi:hypothetical protein [Exiguobacterium sp.]